VGGNSDNFSRQFIMMRHCLTLKPTGFLRLATSNARVNVASERTDSVIMPGPISEHSTCGLLSNVRQLSGASDFVWN